MKFNKEDINIHYVAEKYEIGKGNEYPNQQKVVNIHTHGMEKYGLKNFCLATNYEPNYAAWILNTMCEVSVEDGVDYTKLQLFDTPDGLGGGDGKFHFVCKLVPVTCCEEDCYLVIPCDIDGLALDLPNLFSDRWEKVGIICKNK